MDLIIILLLTLITFPVVEFTEGVPRIILGIIFLLLFPGYTIMAAFYPSKKSLSGVEWVALLLILSFAVVSISGLALNYTSWGIRFVPIYITVAIVIFIASGIAFIRRRSVPEDERFKLHIPIKVFQWRETGRLDRLLYIGLFVVVIGAISVLTYVIVQPKLDEPFTNFYILGPEGKIAEYPQELTIGEQVEIILGIENHEYHDTNYDIVVVNSGEEAQSIGSVSLADGEKWVTDFILIPSGVGDNQQVEFLLYKESEPEPYLNLRLWLDVLDVEVQDVTE